VTELQRGSFRLFRLAGIDVFLHWSWFIVAVLAVNQRRDNYSSLVWNAAEYVALFIIVLLHEFGHALACRQVGGQANRIILWPLGGVAFIAPPQRPGATLWAIAAGPLVNVVLLPVAFVLALAIQWMGWGDASPDGQKFLWALVYINVAVLVFNLLPVYPLDGGQILRSLLWFLFGRARSLLVTVVIGFVGALGLIAVAVLIRSIWLGIMAFFILLRCRRALGQARTLSRLDQMPRRAEFACPACKAAPPIGAFWICDSCGTPFDMFETGALCRKCQTVFGVTTCVYCGASEPMPKWTQALPTKPQ
jgi:Zn-dependent protease